MSGDYYLVQRLRRATYKRFKQAFPESKVKSNPFGYGRLGDYELDYMGSAEFEWGAIPEAFDRLREAGKNLVVCEWTYRDHTFDFLYRKKDGEPFEAWTDWAEGRHRDGYTGKVYEQRPFDGKEPPYELRERVIDELKKPRYGGEWRTDVWWALGANVMWAFKEDGHLPQMLASMQETPVVELRG